MAYDSNKQAAAAINHFVARFDESYRLLARYAALPLVLTPELLNYLHSRFLYDQAPWVAEADLLLSDLCQRVGYEQYVMDPGVRAHLIAELKGEPDGPQRMQEVARLLVGYVEHLARTNPFVSHEDLQRQQWAAMVCLDEQRVATEIAEAFERALASAGAKGEAGRAELLALANLTRQFTPQLQSHPELIEYAKNISQALRQPRLDEKAIQRQRLDQPAVVAGRTLAAPASLREPAPKTSAPLTTQAPATPVKVFCSYSYRDESLVDELFLHLSVLRRQGVIEGWHDRKIVAGEDWEGAIDSALNDAQLILLLISPDYLASDYIYDVEMKRAVERQAAGEAVVIPIILRDCYWRDAPFGKLQVLPRDARPVSTWANRDEAFIDIAQGIRRVAEAFIDIAQGIRRVAGPSGMLVENLSKLSQTKMPLPPLEAPTTPITIFYAYEHRDEMYRDELEKHLAILKRIGVVKEWYDRRIDFGDEWRSEIASQINQAQIILLLVSTDFLVSDYCYDVEMSRALERHESAEAVVIPLILRPCDWAQAPFGKLLSLPKDARPVSIWANQDEAFIDIAQGIRSAAVRWSATHKTERPQRPAPEFKYDVYISYAHADNVALGGDSGWVDVLHRHLEARLSQLIGEAPRIFRNREASVSDSFSEFLIQSIYESAVLLVVLSPAYLSSNWCQIELKAFIQNADQSGGLIVGDRSRIFKVFKTPVPWLELPPELSDTVGLAFFDHEAQTDIPREFVSGRDERYWRRLDDLAREISEMLKVLRTPEQRSVEPRREPQPEVKESAPEVEIPSPSLVPVTVYLAETTTDLVEVRYRLQRELLQYGVRVLPERPLPRESSALTDEIRKDLRDSSFSIHLIGEQYGFIPEDEERSIIHLQLDLALEFGPRQPFHCIVWMPPNLQPASQQQQRFVNYVMTGDLPNVQFLRTNLEDLMAFIHENINRPTRPTPTGESNAVSIYLLFDKSDQDDVSPLEDYLFNQGYEVFSSLSEGEEGKRLQYHQEDLRSCDAVLIYYGRASETWFQMQRMELKRARSYRRSLPFLATGVYIAGPQTAQKDRLRMPDDLVIRNYGEFRPISLAPFLSILSKRV
jgi:hypothetical protein